MTNALTGLRLLDLAGGVAGGYASKLLADLGAEVILVEPPEGDACRRLGPFPTGAEGDQERSGLFLSLHAGKRSVVADPRRPEDAALIQRLVSGTDVLLTAALPERLAPLGLDPETLAGPHPPHVRVIITKFVVNCPVRGRAGGKVEDDGGGRVLH
jgi:crotonobetainyl-CoA:carnitine CoA-transferase CaiB-like acyl-CoA transferase